MLRAIASAGKSKCIFMLADDDATHHLLSTRFVFVFCTHSSGSV
jgi:hypothetical protein